MRALYLLLFSFLAACGSDNSDSDSSPTPTPTPEPDLEVIRVEVEATSCVELLGGCSVKAEGEFTKALFDYDSEIWEMVITYAEGDVAPACDGSNSKIATGHSILYSEKFKLSTVYTFRVCSWNRTKNSYSAGLTKTVTMPAE